VSIKPGTATAVACPNIAFIKYWGDRDPILRIASNGSISMNLGGLKTCTQVTFDRALTHDKLAINDIQQAGQALERVSAHLDRVRQLSGIETRARIESENNFPAGAGIASSASAFAALSLAASTAAGMSLSETELSRLARVGSGSACRSIPAGFVEWQAGTTDEDSYAYSIASPGHWDLVDCIAIVSQEHKDVGSWQGHAIADTSLLQADRVMDATRRLAECRAAILQRDFERLAEISELDCNLMHAIMMTSSPRLIYWMPTTLSLVQAVLVWRKSGIPVFYTIDAGPNVHIITIKGWTNKVLELISQITGVKEALLAHPGGAARLEYC